MKSLQQRPHKVAPRGNFVNSLNGSVSTFLNETLPVDDRTAADVPEHGGWRVVPHAAGDTPDPPADRRSATLVRGAHSRGFGGGLQPVDAEFRLGVFKQGRVEYVEDFPKFDYTGDGAIDDNDLLFCRHTAQRQARLGPDSAGPDK